MIIGYARVSTSDQDAALQIDALEKAGCETIYRESASGAQRERPNLIRCLAALQPDDTLVVWRLDRLGRSLRDLILLLHQIGEAGAGFRSLTEAIDTTSASGQLMFHIFAALSEFERSLIRERTCAGLASARRRGRHGGRPPRINDRTRRKIQRWLIEGSITQSELARRTGVSRSTIRRHLKNEID